MRRPIDEAELCADRLIRILRDMSDASAWSKSVLDRIEGAFTVIVLRFIESERNNTQPKSAGDEVV